jgi:hypothetical protein
MPVCLQCVIEYPVPIALYFVGNIQLQRVAASRKAHLQRWHLPTSGASGAASGFVHAKACAGGCRKLEQRGANTNEVQRRRFIEMPSVMAAPSPLAVHLECGRGEPPGSTRVLGGRRREDGPARGAGQGREATKKERGGGTARGPVANKSTININHLQ